ncbi:MAG: hypothetical protein BWY11_02067 [Firmicutes bacterium ADurb.Bin182]|nr:MAG: hypothetical protein BWY11_02067 [Firmicutes bacterium ADurb.Bin182]
MIKSLERVNGMKLYYICDVCGKKYESAEFAEQCEQRHQLDEQRRKELESQRERRAAQIKELARELSERVKEYNSDYSEPIRMENIYGLPAWGLLEILNSLASRR